MLKRCAFAALSITLLAVAARAADSPLADAAMQGDKAAVRALLKEKVNVNAAQGDGSTALHWAAYRDDLELAKLLLAAGADVKAKTRLGEMTPLFMAAKNGNPAMVSLLLDAKAEVNGATSNGTTPLMLAAASGNVDTVKVLVDRGADVNAKDITNGQAAIMFAAAAGRSEVIKLLAARGADVNAI